MKLVCALIASVIAFSAHAADRKIGNVIAVERDIPNILELCDKNTSNKEGKQTYFFCAIKYTKSSIEVPVSGIAPLIYKDDNCNVSSEVGKGTALFVFGNDKIAMDFEAGKACLAKALANHQGEVKVIVYTLEK